MEKIINRHSRTCRTCAAGRVGVASRWTRAGSTSWRQIGESSNSFLLSVVVTIMKRTEIAGEERES